MHEDHVSSHPGLRIFAPDALCIKPTRRARRSPALRETQVRQKNKKKKLLILAPPRLSRHSQRRGSERLFGGELFLVFSGHLQLVSSTPGSFENGRVP